MTPLWPKRLSKRSWLPFQGAHFWLRSGCGLSHQSTGLAPACHRPGYWSHSVIAAMKPVAGRHGGAGVWQHPAQPAAEPLHAAWAAQGGNPVAAVLGGAQHREAGRARDEYEDADEEAGWKVGQYWCQNARHRTGHSPLGRAAPPQTRSGGNEAMIGNITATPYKPVAEFGVFA